jgi:hypothetical protein
VKLFDDPLHDEFASWPLGLLGADGGTVGEVAAIAAALDRPDDDAFVSAWTAAADRHVDEGEQAERAGRSVHARGHYLRAASFYEVGIHMLYGSPVDERLSQAFQRLTKAFD